MAFVEEQFDVSAREAPRTSDRGLPQRGRGRRAAAEELRLTKCMKGKYRLKQHRKVGIIVRKGEWTNFRLATRGSDAPGLTEKSDMGALEEYWNFGEEIHVGREGCKEDRSILNCAYS